MEKILEWFSAGPRFNDLEPARGRSDMERLVGVSGLDDHLVPLGLHGSGSWVALWRRDARTPWSEAAWVWIDAQGSPWEPFAVSAPQGLAMLALDVGTIFDALSVASREVRRGDAEMGADRS
jgi:hypothetical protein